MSMAMAFEAKTQVRLEFQTLTDISSRITVIMDDEKIRTLAQGFGCEESRTGLLKDTAQRQEGFFGSTLDGVKDEEEEEEERRRRKKTTAASSTGWGFYQ